MSGVFKKEAFVQLDLAADCLKAGGVVFLPTDTVFGLAALPGKSEAVAKIFSLKARSSEKNLPIMASTLAQLEGIGAQIDERVRKLVSSPFCPGPLSIAVGLQGDNVPQWLKGREEIAFRIPDAKFLLELLDSVGPLLVTSANRSGCGTEETSEKALEQLSGSPDFVVHGRQCGSVPSTLVNCRYSPPLIERLGAVSREQLSEYLE